MVYHTKETLPGDISLTDKNDVLYTVTRDEPTSSHTSLGVEVALDREQVCDGVVVKDESKLFAKQMKAAKCDKTTRLNCFNTSFVPSLSYKMIATQFTEQQWNKMISPIIQTTLKAASIVCNLAHAVLYGPEDYQELAVKTHIFSRRSFISLRFLIRLCVIHLLVNSSELMMKLSELRLIFPFLSLAPYNKILLHITYLPAGINPYGDLHLTSCTS